MSISRYVLNRKSVDALCGGCVGGEYVNIKRLHFGKQPCDRYCTIHKREFSISTENLLNVVWFSTNSYFT